MSNASTKNAFNKVRQFHPQDEAVPAQTGEYIVDVKSGSEWRNHKNARLQISVGQPNHEGEKLRATVDWIRNRFTPRKKSIVYVCINDSLQRWNYIFAGMTHDEAMDKAIRIGDEWMDRNSKFINKIPNARFTRWESWRNNEGFENAITAVRAFYSMNAEFRAAIDKNIDDFWVGQKKQNSLGDDMYERFKHFAREYLLEETAVFTLMFRENPAVDFYPGTTLLPCVVFQGRNDVPGLPEGLGTGTFTRIDHVRNKNFGQTPGTGFKVDAANQSGDKKDDSNPIQALGRVMNRIGIGDNWHFANPGASPAVA